MKFSKQERFMQVYAPVHERFERYCKTRAYGEFYFKDIMHDTLLVVLTPPLVQFEVIPLLVQFKSRHLILIYDFGRYHNKISTLLFINS